jgi:septum formation protein
MKTSLRIPLVLASTSPRRIDLLKQVCLNFQVRAPLSEELTKAGEPPEVMVARLAEEKADSVRDSLIQEIGECLVVSADTIVVAPDGKTVLGKPMDERRAKVMLKLLSGKTHSVLTGYCISHVKPKQKAGQKPRKLIRIVKSKVKMRTLSGKMIQDYVTTGEPMDKAGSYGAQGIGTALIERIEGSYTNVVGLPMAEIISDLEKFNLKFLSWIR